MTGTGEHIREARKARGLSRQELADEVKASRQAVGYWEQGINEPNRHSLKKLSAALGVSEKWLVCEESADYGAGVEMGSHIRGIVPIITFAAVARWNEEIEPDTFEEFESISCPVDHGPRTYALRVDGDSMTSTHGRTYSAGSIIFVDPDAGSAVSSGDRVIARLEMAREIVFMVYVEHAGERLLKPLNPLYPMFDGTFSILGKVLGQFSE